MHLAFGDPYGSQTHADWKSKTHVDVLTRNCDVRIDSDQIISKGKYQLVGSSIWRIWSPGMCFKVCLMPLGHRISILWTTFSLPNPKCKRLSLDERSSCPQSLPLPSADGRW